MNKLVVFGSDGTIFDLKPEESTFDCLLEKLGGGVASRKMQKQYLEEKVKGPYKLEERVRLFRGIMSDGVVRVSFRYLREKLRVDFEEVNAALKKRGYMTAVTTSNPAVPYLLLKALYNIDFVFGTELEIDEEGLCTGRYIPLRFPKGFERLYKERYPALADFWTLEPNRYGLAQKLAQVVSEYDIDANESWIVGNKATKVPQKQIIPQTLVFQPADPEIEKEATHVIPEGRFLQGILEYIQ